MGDGRFAFAAGHEISCGMEGETTMVTVKTVEKHIRDIEQFAVRIKHNNRDLRSDRRGLPPYAYERKAKNDMTVDEWRQNRFRPNYYGLEVDVLDGTDNVCHGATKLGSVRDSYSEK
jgi:hypothetical protein